MVDFYRKGPLMMVGCYVFLKLPPIPKPVHLGVVENGKFEFTEEHRNLSPKIKKDLQAFVTEAEEASRRLAENVSLSGHKTDCVQ